jgi:hypothetical protein
MIDIIINLFLLHVFQLNIFLLNLPLKPITPCFKKIQDEKKMLAKFSSVKRLLLNCKQGVVTKMCLKITDNFSTVTQWIVSSPALVINSIH